MKIVIFCGGHGSRLWPVSRQSDPKPFIPLLNGKSFFQITYARFRKDFAPEDIFISSEERHLHFIKSQVPGIPDRNIILEPERKDILAACGLATAVVNRYYPGEAILISWAKHLFDDEHTFLNAIAAAAQFAEKTGYIVSVDSRPSFASVHNGWVKLGKTLGQEGGFEIVQIEKQIEKPEEKVANELFKSGEWIINTGYRVWKSDVILDFYKELQPDMYLGLTKIVDAWGTDKQHEVLHEEYHKFVKDSIEYGIFEKLPNNVRATIAADMGWKDVGISWEFFYKSLVSQKGDNVVEGGSIVEMYDSNANLVLGSKGKAIVLIGMQNVAVIDTPTGLLVSSLSETDKMKKVYEKLEKEHPEFVD